MSRKGPWSTEPLKDETLLIRYTRNDWMHVRSQIERCERILGFYGLSFFGNNDLTVEQVCEEIRYPNSWMQIVSVRTLRGAGYDPAPEGRRRHHCAIKWERMPSDEEIVALINLFDDAVENPHPGP